MSKIIREDSDGVPLGSYSVFYYDQKRDSNGDYFVRDAGFDRDVSSASVKAIELKPREAARAQCNSQPGGCLIFGSAEAEAAWDRWQAYLAKLGNPLDG